MKGYKRPLGYSNYTGSGAPSAPRPQPRQHPKPASPRLINWSSDQWLAALAPVLDTLGVSLDEAQQLGFEASLDKEAERLVRSAQTPEHREAIAAFLQKRPPVYP